MQRPNNQGANSHLFEAKGALTLASEMTERGEYAQAVQAAQRSIEHNIKALYPLVGLDAPHTHDAVTGDRGHERDAFGEVLKRLDLGNDLYVKNGIMRLPWLGKMWSSAHEFSAYGYGGVSPSVMFDPEDARTAVEYAKKVKNGVDALMDSVTQGRIRILFGEA
jgi:HEPN domain-containing protein